MVDERAMAVAIATRDENPTTSFRSISTSLGVNAGTLKDRYFKLRGRDAWGRNEAFCETCGLSLEGRRRLVVYCGSWCKDHSPSDLSRRRRRWQELGPEKRRHRRSYRQDRITLIGERVAISKLPLELQPIAADLLELRRKMKGASSA